MNVTLARIRTMTYDVKQKLKAINRHITKIKFSYSLLAGVAGFAGFATESVL
jgi:hypothetical protein